MLAERGLKKQRGRKRSWVSEEGEKLGPLRREDSGY